MKSMALICLMMAGSGATTLAQAQTARTPPKSLSATPMSAGRAAPPAASP